MLRHNSPRQAVASKRRLDRQPNRPFLMTLVGIVGTAITGLTTMSRNNPTFKQGHLTTPIQDGVVLEDGAQVCPGDGT